MNTKRHPGKLSGRDPGFHQEHLGPGQKIAGATVFTLLMCCHIFLGLGPIREFSPTYDEPVHLTAGTVYWKTGDYRFLGGDHPAFAEMWAAIPNLFLNPLLPLQHPLWISKRWETIRAQYQFADLFLYHNRVSADTLMRAGRLMQLALSCLMGAFLMFVAFSMGGALVATIAGLFWAFSPAMLANGTVISTDLAYALFFFGFFAGIAHVSSMRWNLFSGICLGLAFASKYFALSMIPILVVLMVLEPNLRKSFKPWLIILGTGIFVLAAIYRFTNADVFWDGFSKIIGRSQMGRSSFFLGKHGTQGWLGYFPIVFLVKTPLPLLIGVLAAVGGVLSKKLSLPKWLWLPPVLFFGLACFSKVQIGHRYILVVYPFLFVMAALAMAQWKGKWIWLGVPLMGWLVIGTWMVRPHFLAYFNELVGGPSNGYKYFTDSNVDWGQGLKLLGQSLSAEDKANGIYLSYFGVADPHAEGIRYKDVGSDRIVERSDDSVALGVRPLKFAISVTNLQGTYYPNHAAFAWLKDYSPTQIIGHSIFVYDFSTHPEAIARLEQMRR